jgi:DNA mismatch repair protein MutS
MTKKVSMMQEYFDCLQDMISQYGDNVIVLWQCGAFFETYALGKRNKTKDIYDEGKTQVEAMRDICSMTIVAKKATYKNKDVFMAGFTKNEITLDNNINELMEKGYTVKVIIEDGSYDPIKKIRRRVLLNIFSPGTNFKSKTKETTNAIMCVWLEKVDKTLLTKSQVLICGCSIIDIFTGENDFMEFKKTGNNLNSSTTFDQLERFHSIHSPKEVIFIHNYKNEKKIDEIIQFCGIYPRQIRVFSLHKAKNKTTDIELEKNTLLFKKQNYQREILQQYYKSAKIDYNIFLETSELSNYLFSLQSFCYLLHYVKSHNPELVNNIYEPRYDNNTNKLILFNHALHQLNIVDTQVSAGKYSSLINLLNKCITPMGKRYFNKILLNPSIDETHLKKEYQIIEYVVDNYDELSFIRKDFRYIKDIEKLYRKIVLGDVFPCELGDFFQTLVMTKENYTKLMKFDDIKKYIHCELETSCYDSWSKLENKLKKYFNIKKIQEINNKKYEINFVNKGCYANLDKKYADFVDAHQKLICLQKYFDDTLLDYGNVGKKFVKYHETEKSPPYLELTTSRANNLKKQLSVIIKKTPGGIIRRCFLSKIDGKTKEFEFNLSNINFSSGTGNNKKINGSEMKKIYEDVYIKKGIFQQELKYTYKCILIELQEYMNPFRSLTDYIKTIDVLINKAYIAIENKYCKPEIVENDSAFFSAKSMRHPLIEKIQTEILYVPNDVSLGLDTKGILLFGTNAVGKSSLIKSMGICIVMAQSGMYVPCSEFKYKPYTKIFTRIIGNDNIFKSLSTFQVEMSEFNTIDNLSDENSLVLGDELCSGTEIYSARSLFSAGIIRLNKKGASHIFATHFHDLTNIEHIKNISSLKMKHMEVCYDESLDTLIYNRELKDGQGSKMYGLEVCKFLKFDPEFINLAYEIRNAEFPDSKNISDMKPSSYNNKLKGKCAFCENGAEEMHHLMPQKDADTNGTIEHYHKNHPANTLALCKSCHREETNNDRRRKAVLTTNGLMYKEI